MHLLEHEWMRETLSDLSKEELKLMFNALRDSDDCELGKVFRKAAYEAVQNFNDEREGEYRDAAEVDAKIDRTLHERAYGR